MSSSPNPLELLQNYGHASNLSKADLYLTEDGKSLVFLGGTEGNLSESTVDAIVTYDISTLQADTTATYQLASYFLLCLHPLDYRAYRKACDKASCPSVKITDKKTVLKTLLGEEGYEASQQQQHSKTDAVGEKGENSSSRVTSTDGKEKQRSSHDKPSRHHKGKHDRDKHHKKGDGKDASKHVSKSASSLAVKKEKGPVTNEQVLENLTLMADKRSEKAVKNEEDKPSEPDSAANMEGKDVEVLVHTEQQSPDANDAVTEKERNKLRALLSERIYVTDEELAADREATREIIANEMPVGNSFSVLRAPGRDLSKVLDIYTEVKQNEAAAAKAEAKEQSKKRKSGDSTPSKSLSSDPSKKNKREPKGKPIIIVPNTMTSPIIMVNAKQFFGEKQFVPRQEVLKQLGAAARNTGPSVSFSRKVAAKYSGGLSSSELEYEVMDNPLKLKSKSDWDRIVAVVAQGGSWQFKGWPGSWGNPVDIFSRAMGFYIGMEGTPLPKELQGWSVKTLMISRDKRVMDGVVHSHFFTA
jgi:hypothetical protein